ncbi:MAG: tRNA (adenosine(37)-N6)-threonylcarbamoyltransferase complex transferase subunit TsaD [Candidatus Colwellbacteria bacterium CG10_big_fil_rev_8_21_14_0_10_41_28]|uniref:tRNA N6-adenosine threonylcarbamoyltransferase n=1 Tax=Candidatus Colwellbacteria bacterium CG10_big_fil_rev_8_21_14_0_10_41_28 TaxID=1974539 RepID=A0A2H0VJ87_9BACT|nr:MAG: tRNA (adenosine(37)-N6)-threonylcarbamoyltransferase complex transferase subunit TsaD [Candidatus Colwellbacteria bacterium CG10_big_fil_rev_8_21_14_0_10_41_28]
MKIFAIETSCDETAMALIEAKGGIKSPRFKVKKSIISSQIDVHRPFGGVVPNLARREHLKNLPTIYKEFFGEGNMKGVDKIAVTVGPGLEPALWTGVNYAKEIAKENNLELIGANHLEGHLLSPLLSLSDKDRNIPLPAIGLVVSGGHTILTVLKKLDDWKKIGETRDDAVGEAYDKVARMLGEPYPGGPEIQRLAEKGDEDSIKLPRPMLDQKNYDFSFSGLKTASMYYLREKRLTPKLKANFAASFQKAATDVLVEKTARAVEEFGAKSVLLAGGVAANKHLRENLKKKVKKMGKEFYVSEFKYSGDNAAMIGVAGYLNDVSRDKKGKAKKYQIKAQANLNL